MTRGCGAASDRRPGGHGALFDLGVDSIDVDRYREPEVKPEKGAQEAAAGGPAARRPAQAQRARRSARGACEAGGHEFDDVRLPVEADAGRVQLAPTGEALRRHLRRRHHARREAAEAAAFDERARARHRHRRAGERRFRFDARRGPWRCQHRAQRHGQYRRGDVQVPRRQARLQRARTARSTASTSGTSCGARWRSSSAPRCRRAPGRCARSSRRCRQRDARKGRRRNDDLRVDMDYLKARGKGTLGHRHQAIDYRLVAEVYKLPPEGTRAARWPTSRRWRSRSPSPARWRT